MVQLQTRSPTRLVNNPTHHDHNYVLLGFLIFHHSFMNIKLNKTLILKHLKKIIIELFIKKIHSNLNEYNTS